MGQVYDQGTIRRAIGVGTATPTAIINPPTNGGVSRVLSLEISNSGATSTTITFATTTGPITIWQLILATGTRVVVPVNPWGIMESIAGDSITFNGSANTTFNLTYVQP